MLARYRPHAAWSFFEMVSDAIISWAGGKRAQARAAQQQPQ